MFKKKKWDARKINEVLSKGGYIAKEKVRITGVGVVWLMVLYDNKGKQLYATQASTDIGRYMCALNEAMLEEEARRNDALTAPEGGVQGSVDANGVYWPNWEDLGK